MFNTFFSSLEIFFLIVFGIQVAYLGIFGMLSIFKYTPRVNPGKKNNHIVVFIPGYNEDRIILETAEQALLQSYPSEKYEVVILADHFQKTTIEQLRKLGVTVIEVHFENSTKAKSLNKGLEKLAEKSPDIAVVLDADNHMAPDFLEQVNAAFNTGHQIIQGHRTAKNSDTVFALLDAINEEIGNSIFRKGHRVLGMSSGLIGSAMAFDFFYLKKLMADIQDVAGEDKMMELKILKEGKFIEYLPEAVVLDEKVSNPATFSKQRTRWVGVQLYFFKHYFLNGLKELFTKGNFQYFDKAFQMSLIPKVILIGFLGIMGVIAGFGLLSRAWLFMAAFYYLALLMAVPRKFYTIRLIKAILYIPQAIFYMILGILKIRRSTASKFEVTEKGS